MPLVSYDSPARWEADYRIPGEPPGFRRAWFEGYVAERWARLLDRQKWPPSASVLVVGCAYGWMVDFLLGRGFGSVWGTETSGHVQATKGVEATSPARILNIDVTTAAGRTALRQATGINNNWRVVVTEDVLPCYSDAEIAAFAPGLRSLLHQQGQLVHVVSTHEGEHAMDPAFNRKTLAGWQAALAPDVVVATWELNGGGA